MTDNPYAVGPVAERSAVVNSNPASESPMELARSVFLAWEKLRPVFIGILGVPTLVMVGFSGQRDLSLVFLIAFGAIVANACYMAGPIAETYLRWLGLRSPYIRLGMFGAGTILTLVAAFLSLGTYLKPI